MWCLNKMRFKFMMHNDDDDDNKPVWPTWAVGVLSVVRDVETYNRRHTNARLRGLSWGVLNPQN
jgi:hypothetical protein